jgi:hypothetical protein
MITQDNTVDTIRASSGALNLLSTDLAIDTAGKGLAIREGTNGRLGQATLVGGTVNVANTTVTANTRVFLQRMTAGGTVGNLTYTVSAGVGFTINSDSATDTSLVNYLLVEAA